MFRGIIIAIKKAIKFDKDCKELSRNVKGTVCRKITDFNCIAPVDTLDVLLIENMKQLSRSTAILSFGRPCGPIPRRLNYQSNK